MKRVLVVVLAFALLLTGCVSNMKLTKELGKVSSASSSKYPIIDKMKSQTMEDNGFIFKYGIETKNVLNTFNGSFTKDLIRNGTITVLLKLTDQELLTVFNQFRAMNIMNYPDNFNEGHPIPHATYDLTIRIDGKTKRIIWDVGLLSNPKEIQQLTEWVNNINKMLENKEEYKKLPPAIGGYD